MKLNNILRQQVYNYQKKNKNGKRKNHKRRI